MATTTATINISSSDLTGDALALSTTATLTKAGTVTGLDQTSGVSRKIVGTAADNVVLFSADDYTGDKSHKVYVKNLSTTATDYIELKLGATEIGRLYAGDFAFLPWAATGGTAADIKVDTIVDNTTVEYMLIYEA
jgi:hypothetical protein